MIQFILYFLAIVGVYSIGQHLSFVVKLIKDYGKEDELNINVKGHLVCSSKDIITRLEQEQRNKRVFSDKFPERPKTTI